MSNASVFDVTPAGERPQNALSKFSNPDNMFPVIRWTLGICLGLSSLVIMLRIWGRFFVQRVHGLEDYTMIIAWLCFIPYTVLGALGMNYGSGVHQWDIMLSTFFKFLKIANALEIIYNPLIFVTKLSILMQYDRIFCPHRSGWTHYTIYMLICINFLFYVAVTIAQVLACRPREKIWHPYLPGTCLDLAKILIVGAVVNLLSDLSILALPLFKIWQLKLSRFKKAGVSAVFAFGVFGCLASIFRLSNNVRFAHTQDATWDLTPVALWTLAEIACGIICGCLPTLPLLFQHIAPKIKSTLSSMKSKKNTVDSGGSTVRGIQVKRGVYIEMNHRTASSESREAFTATAGV